jgi:hypothetical protein
VIMFHCFENLTVLHADPVIGMFHCLFIVTHCFDIFFDVDKGAIGWQGA